MSYLEKDVNDLLEAMANSFDPETGEYHDEDILAFQELTETEIAPKMERMQKARNYIKGEISAIDEEIKRLQGHKKRLQTTDERLSARILYGLKAVEIWGAKLNTTLFRFGTRRSYRLIVDEGAEKNLPPEFIRTEISVNKAELKKHISETGEIFDGVRLEETESLQVK